MMLEPRKSPRGMVPVLGRMDHVYNAYLDEVGVRDPEKAPVVEQALACAADARFRKFLDLLKTPFYRKVTLAAIAKICDITQPEWSEFWRKSQHQRAIAMAQNGITEHVMPDIVEDAKSKRMPCDRCDGYGVVQADVEMSGKAKSKKTRTCPACAGEGTVRKSGDTDSRKMLLEVTGLTNKKGSAVQITQHFGGMGIESAVDRLNKVDFAVIDIEPEPAAEDNSNSESS
jgi:hypothetical protein